MCLVTKQKEAIVTTKDMIVYKLLTWNLKSLTYKFQWEINKLENTSLTIKPFCIYTDAMDYMAKRIYKIMDLTLDDKHLYSITTGFHAAMTKVRAGDYGYTCYKALIPAGSEVFFDETGLIVSNQMMILPNES
jgi:hypothetical protein